MKTLLSTLATTLALVLAPALTAQVSVTWSTPTAVNGPGDVQRSGMFVAALSAATADETVSGVTFTTSSAFITIGNASTINYTPGQFSSGDSAYDAIVNRGFYTPLSARSTITFSGLTSGHDYQIQLWTPAWDADFPTRVGGEGYLEMGNTSTQPTFVVGTFTASLTSEYIEFDGANGSLRGLLAAVTLHDLSAVPEPSTYALFAGLAALGLGLWRRNRAHRAALVR